jgi:CubicO group peptidase (beta-lactamase class C family)
MNAEDLARFDAEIEAYAAASRPLLQSVLILHQGKLISEHYWRGFAPTSHQNIFSITKTVVSALIGMALADRRLTLTDTMAQWFPEMSFAPGAHAAAVTIRHLLTMTAGFQEVGGRVASRDPIPVLLRRAAASAPGEKFHYSNEDVDLLAAVLERAVGEPAVDYAYRRLFMPLGIWRDIAKSYRKRLWKTDKQGRVRGSRGLHLTTRELASFGQLYLQGGWWQDEQLLLPEFVAASTTAQVSGGYPERVKYGYLWWVSVDSAGHPAFFASGAGGQYVYVLPSLNLVIVITSTLTNMVGFPHRVMIARLVTDLINRSSG